MIWKMIRAILVIFLLVSSLTFLYQNFPQDPIEMKMRGAIFERAEVIDYNETSVFAENMRFNHNNISYFIDAGCVEVRRDAMIRAFGIFEDKMKLISFYEVESDFEADIGVGCSDDYIELDERLFVAGEGGPSRIINTSLFGIIEKGKILLYDDPQCDYPIVEVHELLHVFGFDHVENPKSIMYYLSGCDQRITPDMVELIDRLYSIEPLADVAISELVVVKKGRYLDFNITVLNEGLVGVDEINLTILADDKEVYEINLGEIGVGYGRTLRVTNIKLSLRGAEKIDFIIDKDNVIRELNKDNNFAEIAVGS